MQSSRWVSGRFIVTFAGINSRNDAEAVRGITLLADVPVTEQPEDAEEFYDRQLIGLRVLLSDGSQLGTVADVLHLPAQDMLSVKTDSGERLVPFVSKLVPVVDLGQGLVQLAELPGLVDDQATEDGSNGSGAV